MWLKALRKFASIERVGTLRFQRSLIENMWIRVSKALGGFQQIFRRLSKVLLEATIVILHRTHVKCVC